MTDQIIYPIGKFKMPASHNVSEYKNAVNKIADLPTLLSRTLGKTGENQLIKTYRKGGWNVKQIVHHMADSHINCYIRLKLALTEDNPTIKPYDENRWAAMPDYTDSDIESSVALLAIIHKKIGAVLNSVSDSDLQRTFYHPENKQTTALYQLVQLYAWHGEHHVGQIKNALTL